MLVHAIFYFRDGGTHDLHVSQDAAELAEYLRDFLEINDCPTFPELELPELADAAGRELEAIIIYKQARVT